MPATQFGRYEILGEIARGGMSTVYHAYDPRFRRDVALKILPRELFHKPEFRERFNREALAVAGLEHPAIVPVHDYGEEDGEAYLVMRLMRGGSLQTRLNRQPLSVQEAARVLGPIARALDFAHSKGVIHRDIKPANILFDESGEPYLSDFGIVKLLVDEGSNLTAEGGMVGTPAYMSPEQVQGLPLDGRSDIYALGGVLFAMLTGKRPYESETPMGLALKHVLEPTPDIRAVNAGLADSIQAIIQRAMAKTPADRYPTAGALVAALVAAANDIPTHPSLPGDPAMKAAAAAAIAAAEASAAGTAAAGSAGPPAAAAPRPSDQATIQLAGPPSDFPPGPAFRRNRQWLALGAIFLLLFCVCGAIGVRQFVWLPAQERRAMSPEEISRATRLAATFQAGTAIAAGLGDGTPAGPTTWTPPPSLVASPVSDAPEASATATAAATIAPTDTPAVTPSPPAGSPTPALTVTLTPTITPTVALAGPVLYLVTIETGCEFFDATDANVFIRLVGAAGESRAVGLDLPEVNDFRECESDTYFVNLPGDLGALDHIEIWHDNTGFSAGWRLNWVNIRNNVTNEEWFFPCFRWLSAEEEDGATFRRVFVDGPCE